MEIWSKIFGYLDFETVQKTATLVCKLWFDMIRNDSVLSGELVLNSIQQIDLAPSIGARGATKVAPLLQTN